LKEQVVGAQIVSLVVEVTRRGVASHKLLKLLGRKRLEAIDQSGKAALADFLVGQLGGARMPWVAGQSS
jgi:hypothetical protein